jgi:hypothetical protein
MNRSQLLVALAVGVLVPLAGCSEAVPPPSEGAWWAQFVTGGQCAIGTPVAATQVGDMTKAECADKTAPVDQAQHCGMAMDGKNGVRTYCAVQQQGATFRLEGYAAQGANLLQFTVPSITTAATAQAPAHGMVTYTSSQVVQTYLSPDSEPCDFYFNAAQASQLAPGRMWVTFTCPAVQSSSTSQPSVCAIDLGVVAFQNCDE